MVSHLKDILSHAGPSWDHLGATLGRLVEPENGDFAWEVLKKTSFCVVVCCRVVVCGVVCSCMLLLVSLNMRENIFCNTSYAKTPFEIIAWKNAWEDDCGPVFPCAFARKMRGEMTADPSSHALSRGKMCGKMTSDPSSHALLRGVWRCV